MSGRALPLIGVVLAAGLLPLCAAPSASAYSIGGRAWPGGEVTYHTTARGYAAPVNRAARILNRAGVGVRLRSASRTRADVIVAYGGRACEGEALVGFHRFAFDDVYLGRGCPDGLVTLTAVHELAHVLGLDHETRRCARMNPSFDSTGTPTYCRPHPLEYWLAHPLQRDDRRGLRAIYG